MQSIHFFVRDPFFDVEMMHDSLDSIVLPFLSSPTL